MVASTQTNFIKAVRQDPLRWMKEWLGASFWPGQEKIILSVRDNKHTACRSGHSTGKSYVAACLVLWYLFSHIPSYVVTTASAWTGVQKIIWPQVRRLLKSAPKGPLLGGTILTTEYKCGELWGAFGVSPNDPENFSGFHSEDGVFVIVDEASLLNQLIYEAIVSLINTPQCRLLLIGNPLKADGPLFDAFSSSIFSKLHLDCYDAVKYHDRIPGLVSQTWIEERKIDWGESSPAYQARVRGNFPDTSEDMIIPLHWVEAAIVKEKPARRGPIRLGVDVARFGSDTTVLLARDDRCIIDVRETTKEDTMETVGRVIKAKKDYRIADANIFVDDTGLGGGVTDRLRELGHNITPVIFGAGAIDSERFLNVRAESYWNLRDALNPELGNKQLKVPQQFSAAMYEATTPKMKYTSKGQIKLEEKSEVKKRLKRSPDRADALAMTYAPRMEDEDFVV